MRKAKSLIGKEVDIQRICDEAPWRCTVIAETKRFNTYYLIVMPHDGKLEIEFPADLIVGITILTPKKILPKKSAQIYRLRA